MAAAINWKFYQLVPELELLIIPNKGRQSECVQWAKSNANHQLNNAHTLSYRSATICVLFTTCGAVSCRTKGTRGPVLPISY